MIAQSWQGVNYLAVLVAAIAAMAVGFAWYSGGLFGKAWARARGIDMNDPAVREKMRKTSGRMYGTTFLATLVRAIVLAAFIGALQAYNLRAALSVAFWLWLGFLATVQLTDAIFGDKPRQVLWIDTSYQLVTMLVMAAILAVWPPHG
jgi:Protein of unknown function (DUF1761)